MTKTPLHMYVCVIISNDKTGMYLRSLRCFIRQIGEKWGAWIWFAFSDKRRNQAGVPVRIIPIIDVPPLEPFPCSNDVPGYFDRVPLNSVATEPHKARLSVPVVSPRSAGPSSPDLFLLWETTHRRTSPTVVVILLMRSGA